MYSYTLIPNNAFAKGKLGNRISVDDIHYLVSILKGSFSDRNLTPITIRQSVLANCLNEKNTLKTSPINVGAKVDLDHR